MLLSKNHKQVAYIGTTGGMKAIPTFAIEALIDFPLL